MATILLIEDEGELLTLYQQWLEAEHDVRPADSVTAAIERLDEDVDCAIIDRLLPEGAGEDVIDAIEDRGLDCPAGIISAVEPDLDIIDLRVEEYFVKPVRREELRAVADRLLAVNSYDEEVREYYRLARKKAALTSAIPEQRLADTAEYQELLDELAAAEARAAHKLDSVDELRTFEG